MMARMEYRGYLFDADNTLFDYDAAEAAALEVTFDHWLPGVPHADAAAAYRLINRRYWDALEEGTVTMDQLKPGRFAELLSTLGRSGDPREVSTFYLDRLGAGAELLPGARELVEALAARALLCLVTNGISTVQRSRLARSGLGPRFASVLVSEELGFAKPDPRFFAAACAALRLPPSDVLCVGDNPVADVGGAQAAGIDACWFAPGGGAWPGPGPAPRFVARSLSTIVNFRPGRFP
jgi:2-haloacid dehalogenase